jgi:hypothetical protein
MHYTAAISHFGTSRRATRRRTEAAAPVAPLKAAPLRAAWRNWWTMNVEAPPAIDARQTRAVGARGRMVVPPR